MIGLVLILPLEYNNEPTAVYSYGMATDFISFTCLIFMLFDFVIMGKNFNKLKKKKIHKYYMFSVFLFYIH